MNNGTVPDGEKLFSNSNSNKIMVPNAREAMNKFKMEAANEVGVNLKQGYNGSGRRSPAGRPCPLNQGLADRLVVYQSAPCGIDQDGPGLDMGQELAVDAALGRKAVTDAGSFRHPSNSAPTGDRASGPFCPPGLKKWFGNGRKW